ncbi:DinB family protein [Micromonospora costi]|uniref:DinB family protein n=1 Tax=Micromonospora costi TaxID=1530042 RepID=UPI00340DE75D
MPDSSASHGAGKPAQGFAWSNMFVHPDEDPRSDGNFDDERTILVEYLRDQRLTLQLKCADLDAEQLARRAVPPSTMSLLGLVRHMAEVERGWFRRVMAGEDAPPIYRTEADRDADFNEAIADPDVVAEAWRNWRAEIEFAEHLVDRTDLGAKGRQRDGTTISLRELLVHMIEEYARHNGHADLLRELIDGRIGQ